MQEAVNCAPLQKNLDKMARESLVHQTSQQLLNEQDSSHQIDLDEDHEVIVNKSKLI